MLETDTGDYSVRTEKNICDSDATLILHSGRLTGGTRLTWKLAQRHDKPFLTVDLKDVVPQLAVPGVQDWLSQNQVQILNVAGPRESSMPGIQKRAENFLKMALSDNKSNEDVCGQVDVCTGCNSGFSNPNDSLRDSAYHVPI